MSESTLLSIPSISLSKSLHHDHKLTARKPLLSTEFKRHLWFGGIVALHMLCNLALLPTYIVLTNFYAARPGLMQRVFTVLTMGAFLGQFTLLIIWMSFGCFRAPWRQLTCTLLVFGGGFFLIYAMVPQGFPESLVAALPTALLMTSVLWFAYCGLLVLRQFTSITIEFRQLKQQAIKLACTYSISSMLLLILTFVVPCTLLRWGMSIQAELVTLAAMIGFATFVCLVVLLPLSLAFLRPQYAIRSSGAAMLFFGLFVGLIYWSQDYIGLEPSVIMVGAGTTVMFNLALLRIVGLRWLPTITASGASETSSPIMSPSLN